MPLSELERKIKDSIVVGSEDDPNNPEFPPDNPRFPATTIKRIYIPPFRDVSIKDESTNPTGTHKDRMAWEIVVTYKEILEAIDRGELETLPRMSILSTGNAALAIQTMLGKYGLPDLSVLVDNSTDPRVAGHLEENGCRVFSADLSERMQISEDILKLTDNTEGIDITAGRGFQAIGRFYDWFSYEVLNSSPDYVIVPYGTGDLFGNIITISVNEVTADKHDPRFQGRVDILRRCNFIGAKTDKRDTEARHLYADHLPFEHVGREVIERYKSRGLCGRETGIYSTREVHLDQALDIARRHGIKTGPSGIFGLNWLLENEDRLSKDAKYVVVNTGFSRIDSILTRPV
jgi:hypothetical protein